MAMHISVPSSTARLRAAWIAASAASIVTCMIASQKNAPHHWRSNYHESTLSFRQIFPLKILNSVSHDIRRVSVNLTTPPKFLARSEHQSQRDLCEFAWNKNPALGVICIQSGPRG